MLKTEKSLTWITLTALSLFCLGFPGVLFSAEPVSKSAFRGVAIGGHDTVEYHRLSTEPHAAAIQGRKSFMVKWKGAKWRFLSKASADAFSANPEKYSPAYNGFCANALSLGKGLLKTDGTHWEIIGNQLFLFYAASGRDRWVAANDPSPFIASANEAWKDLSQ